MRALLFIVFLALLPLKANDVQLASSILNTIVSNITKKDSAKLYLYKRNDFFQLDYSHLNLVKNCQDADIVIVPTTSNLPEECRSKILFGTKYAALKDKDIIGAFFWQKGRPNILFYKNRLEKKHIKLDESFSKYIENE